jgi:hypothetical protein
MRHAHFDVILAATGRGRCTEFSYTPGDCLYDTIAWVLGATCGFEVK